MKFPSSRLEAVYAIPFEDSRVNVFVTNTTAQPIILNGDAVFAGANGHHPIQGQLGAHETQVVNLPHGLVKKASGGAVSLSHNGGKGALLAVIHLQDADRGYSESVNFVNPVGKTTERHGAGLRLGSVNNDPLRPVVAVRNIGDSATTVAARVPYSKQSGDAGTIALPQVSLAPGEIKLLNTSNPQLRHDNFATAGLEIEYTGAPGSVIASASSVSRSGNHVFALPMKDPQGGLSSTGGYPWFIQDTASTVVFIKNVTDQPQDFILRVVHSEGVWRMRPRLLDPRQTIAIDVKKISDSQERGMDGDLIPSEAASGHISWSARGTSNKKLIGRAQMVDFEKGLASTYECQCHRPGWAFGAQMIPQEPGGFDSLFAGDNASVDLQSLYYDCFGNGPYWFTVHPSGLTISSANPSVATFDGNLVTAWWGGNTVIDVSWTEITYTQDPCDSSGCPPPTETYWTAVASTSISVPVPTLNGPTSITRGESATFTITGARASRVSNWSFSDGTNPAVNGPNGTLNWAGTMVTSGTISVTVRTTSLTKDVTVNDRTSGFAFSAVMPQKKQPPYNCPDGTTLSFTGTPTVENRTIGLSCISQAFGLMGSELTSGPNSGYKYITSASNVGAFTTEYSWALHPDLENTNSEFYKAQCGNYNAQTNPNGFIDGATLLSGVTRHESGPMNSHYAFYKEAQDNSSNNMGVVGEKQIGPPSESFTQFSTRVQQLLVSKGATIQNAFKVEPCSGVFDATCTTLRGFVNFRNPEFQPCQ